MSSDAQPSTTANYQSLKDSGLPFIVANRLGMVCEINEAFEAVFGWPRRELIGESLSQILPAAHKMSHQLAFSRFQLPPTQSRCWVTRSIGHAVCRWQRNRFGALHHCRGTRGRVVFRRDPQASDAACVMVSRAT